MLNTVVLVCLNICKNILPLIQGSFPSVTSFVIDLLSLIIFPCHFTRLWKFCDIGLNIFIMTKPVKLLVTCWQATLHHIVRGSHLRFSGGPEIRCNGVQRGGLSDAYRGDSTRSSVKNYSFQ